MLTSNSTNTDNSTHSKIMKRPLVANLIATNPNNLSNYAKFVCCFKH